MALAKCYDTRKYCLKRMVKFQPWNLCDALASTYPVGKCPFAKETITDKPYAMKEKEDKRK